MKKLRQYITRISLVAMSLVVGMLMFPATALAGFGIDPGKVLIENLHGGAHAEFSITIYNQNDYDTTYAIIPRVPDYTKDGAEPFPFLDWITISPNEVDIDASDQVEVKVIIAMPEASDYSGKRSEAWISFKEKSDEMVQVEIVSRILINTREETIIAKNIDIAEEKSVPLKDTSSLSTDQPEASPYDEADVSTDPVAQVAPTLSSSQQSQGNNITWYIFGGFVAALVIGEGAYLYFKKRRGVNRN